MKYNVVEVVRLPRDQVFPVYPDLLRSRAHLLPSVEKCVVLEKIVDGHLVRMRTSWTARADVIPAFIRNALPEGSIGWIDNAVWNNAKYRADWSHDIPIVRGAVENKGYTQFVDDGDETIIEVHGELTVHPDKFPLVPTALGRRLAPMVEQLIVSNLEKNLRQNNENVARYLEEEVG